MWGKIGKKALTLALCVSAISSSTAKHRPRPRARTLPAAVADALRRSPKLASAYMGMQVVSLRDGRVLYANNAGRLLVPASNTKLFTTALALLRLGPAYRFKTSVVAEGEVDAAGVLHGNLAFIGRGDPSMSGRAYPFVQDAEPGDPVLAVGDLAAQVAASGIRSVNGDIVGDDTHFVYQPYPSGWAVGDITEGYGAPVSALVVNDNTVMVTVTPGVTENAPAAAALSPGLGIFTVDNRARTAAEVPGGLHTTREPGAQDLEIWGAVPPGHAPIKESLAVGDPALFAATLLREELLRRGIAVTGRALPRHRYVYELPVLDSGAGDPPLRGREVASRTSPPLSELLQLTDKVSQNLHAEIMLRETGAVRRGVGSSEAGLAELKDFLKEAGIDKDQFHFVDGSGLSRNTLVSPEAITSLLQYLYRSPQRDIWLGLLPIGGRDGTLAHRFAGDPRASRIRGKTGTVGGVRALSGYAETRRYGLVAFSFIVNDAVASGDEITRFLDSVALALVD